MDIFSELLLPGNPQIQRCGYRVRCIYSL